MLNRIKRYLGQIALLVACSTGMVQAEDTFEDVGTVTQVNKVAKVIFIDGRRMAIDENVIVTYENREEHLLNFVEEGMLMNISGLKGSNGVYVITSAYIYPKKQ